MLPKLLVLYSFLQFTAPQAHRTLFDSKNCGHVQSHNSLATSPWLASIRAVNKDSGIVFTICAGALINQKYVVTSAECLLNKESPVGGVQLGIAYVENFTTGSPLPTEVKETFYGIQDKIIHPSCQPKACLNNIALIRLNRLVHYTEFLQPICLPYHKRMPVVGSTVYTSIWGPIDFPSKPGSKKNVPSSLITNANIITTMTWRNSRNEICDAHLGTPLVFKKNNQFYLFGMLLNTKRNNCQLYYLNMFNYLRWLEKNVYSKYDRCKTPENETRWCVPLGKCPVLMNVFANPKKKYEDYLRKYICSNDSVAGFQVCCPKSINSAEMQAESTNLNGLSNKKFCGYQRRDDYLSNDTAIAIDEFPWLSSIRALDEFNVEYSACSGSLINARYVITSAYCLEYATDIVSVRLGEYNLLNKTDCVSHPEIGVEDCNEPEDFGIEKVIVHPFYFSWTYINDIALIRLNTTVLFSDFIRPICLPIPSLFKAAQLDDEFYITSFAQPNFLGTDYLKQKLYYTWIQNEICQRMQTLRRYQMCLLPNTMSTDRFFPCDDNDGAPAMISNKGQWTLEGITTGSSITCNVSKPIVLSKISSYLPWIRENVKD